MRIGVKPGQWGWSFDELVACWRAAEEVRFDILSCFDHVAAAPAGLAAWDAPSLLTAMAGVTERITLAVDVLNVSLRHPFLLASELAVAQAASGGRLAVGLGAGSYRLARCCQVLPALWRGEEVTDPELGLSAASLGPLAIEPPPIFVGGTARETMTVAAGFADGWNAVVADAGRYAELASQADDLCAPLARERPLRKAAQVFVRDIDLANARQLVADLEAAGAESATFVLVDERGPDAVRALAEAVL